MEGMDVNLEIAQMLNYQILKPYGNSISQDKENTLEINRKEKNICQPKSLYPSKMSLRDKNLDILRWREN